MRSNTLWRLFVAKGADVLMCTVYVCMVLNTLPCVNVDVFVVLSMPQYCRIRLCTSVDSGMC